MQTGQQVSSKDQAAPSNGASTLHDLFVLTDEQILEIEPEAQDVAVRSSTVDAGARTEEKRDSPIATLPQNDGLPAGSPNTEATSHQSRVTPRPSLPHGSLCK